MPRKPWPYGKMVINGVLQYLAPTTIQKTDPTDPHGGGCPKKFVYRYNLGFKGEEKAFQDLGNKCHEEVETHLGGGGNTLGPITSAMRRFLPEPDPTRTRILLEHDIGEGDLSKASLICEGVPLVGYTDIIDFSGHYLDENAEPTNDPVNTIEIGDWKFGAAKKGSDRDFSLNPSELPDDTQVVTYGVWTVNKTPRIDAPMRLSHVYTNTKGKAASSKSTILIPRERLLHRWEYVRSVVRLIKDVAREVDPEKVPGNIHACESFGGCPYVDQCSTPKNVGLEQFFGGQETMGIIDSLNLPGAQPTPTVTAGPSGVAAALGLDIASQMAAFGAPPPPPATIVPPGFGEACDFIKSRGYGFPPLAGDAAAVYAALMKQRHPGIDMLEKYPGTGDMAKIGEVKEVARLVAIATEIAPLPVKPGAPNMAAVTAAQAQPVTPPAPPPVAAALGLVSPETPASNPAIASIPVEGFASPMAVTPGVGVPGLMASVPASVAAPIVAAGAAAASTVQTPPPADDKPKSGKGSRGPRKAKADGASGVPSSGDDARWLFINALPNVAFEDCARYVAEWSVGLAKHYKIAPHEDIRCASQDHPLGYGKALPALTAVARKAAHSLPPGAYYLDTRDSALAAAVAEGFVMARVPNTDGTDGDPVFELIVKGTRA